MNQTRLHDWHLAAGAKMAPFAGYDMPISYPIGSVEEHLVTRRSVGLFDIDHMGQVEVTGPGADAFVSRLVSARVLDMKDGDARYSLLLSEGGTVIDDLFVYKIPGAWWIVVNASNREEDLAWMNSLARAHEREFGQVHIVDRSEETYMIAVQGPRAIELLDLVSDTKVSELVRFTSGNAKVLGVPCLVGRTGYTGEDGVELFFPAEDAVRLWTGLLSEGEKRGIETKAIGLGARDSLRFEAGMPLHGHELSKEISPLEAGFKWACDLEKDFVGKEAVLRLAESGATRKLVGLSVSGGVPREGYEVQDEGGRKVGTVVAGMFCPSVKLYAANAFVEPAVAKSGTALRVIIRGKPAPAVVVKRPLYVPTYRR
ncbi:MAG TPA: glycine cleavage system aminomethyltransferase GcvT [Spirochaetales bacterium]|nr:glycine cleavage system aminomethyltransferase GcvT [Spirochaetales bacterium]HPG85691.1 glycine cleavage system aminomethyltransferase GcvT [Spirochaetales bacterium]